MNSQDSASRSRGIKIRRFTVEQMILAKNLHGSLKNKTYQKLHLPAVLIQESLPSAF